jgi:hypothetical protein
MHARVSEGKIYLLLIYLSLSFSVCAVEKVEGEESHIGDGRGWVCECKFGYKFGESIEWFGWDI